MSRFELVSDYQPTGDQPQAIAELVDGLHKGYKHQTLLGATGTGKSLSYHDPVFIVEKTQDKVRSYVRPIGEVVDELFSIHQLNLRQDRDTQILDVDNTEITYFAQAFDPITYEVGLRPIQSFIRHDTPSEMYHLETSCGRSATFTGDHNLWVLRDGHLQLIKTSEAQETDYIPVPETLLTESDLQAIDTFAVLSDRRLFVHASKSLQAYIESHGNAGLVNALVANGIKHPYSKLSSIQREIKGQGIRISTFQGILRSTNNLGGHWDSGTTTVGSLKQHDRIPSQLALTPEFLRFMGYYIAEGNHQDTYIILSNHDDCIRNDIENTLNKLGIPFGIRATSDYQVSSKALAEMLAELCGENAFDKHLPEFWPELSNENLGQLLRAYFDGDGTVGKASDVTAVTASKQLASDLMYALLKLGIWTRLRRTWKRATNSNHAGNWYYQITVSGQANLRLYQKYIGFSVGYKAEALERQQKHTEHSNVDVVPISGSDLNWMRLSLGLGTKSLSNICDDLSRSAIQLFEKGKRSPRRSTLRKLLDALLIAAQRNNHTDSRWYQLWQEMDSLCKLRWTRIATVKQVNYEHPHVYDLCVPGAETFLAGVGGFFVHNTYVAAQVVNHIQKPTLVIAHNKTLAAQLYSEFKELFPRNAVEYFVSYYDYYQPEAYVPRIDLYVEKESDINEEIERLRLSAAAALMTRKDVLIVASVSCIYGLGSPAAWNKAVLRLKVGQTIRRDDMLRHLVKILYDRNDLELKRGTFRVRGDTLEIMPAYMETAFRVMMFGDEIERIVAYDPLTGEIFEETDELNIFPARHYVAESDTMRQAILDIEAELEYQLKDFRSEGKLLEAQRLEQRTRYDLEMLREVGFCTGIENYSRHMDQRAPGTPPWTLLDYFPKDYLMIIDESHMSIPQIRGMFNGDRARKETLVDFGFRLPCALDNRPLNFEEFEQRTGQLIYTSATPGPYELQHAQQVVQLVIRPTGIVDPEISVRPVMGQVDDLLKEVNQRIKRGERVLVTTLTKRMAEDLSSYLTEMNIRVHYLHSEIDTLQRIEILRDLRLGVYDVVVGINLLREGLDLPEVSLVAILDADKEGFLRSDSALIQTIGRAARHINGQVIMYADRITDSMRRAIDETDRRRAIQVAYNKEHNLQPAAIVKSIRDLTDRVKAQVAERKQEEASRIAPEDMSVGELDKMIREIEKEMKAAAKNLEFEKAAALRDQIVELRRIMVLKEEPVGVGNGMFDDDEAGIS